MRQLDPKVQSQLMIANSINVSSWANLKRSMQFLLYLLMVNMSSWGKFLSSSLGCCYVLTRKIARILRAHRKSILCAWFFSSNQCLSSCANLKQSMQFLLYLLVVNMSSWDNFLCSTDLKWIFFSHTFYQNQESRQKLSTFLENMSLINIGLLQD